MTAGRSVAMGGYLSSRRPISLTRELVRDDAGRHSSVVVPFGGLETDLAAQSPHLREVSYGTVSLGIFGLCPTVRRRVERGDLAAVEFGATSILRALQAGARSDPAFPMGWVDRATGDDPPTVPALRPDVGLIHVPFASPTTGTAWGYGTGLDLITAAASREVVVSFDVETDDPPRLPTLFVLPPHLITRLVHRPWGAFPTGCFPLYAPDAAFFVDYQRAELGRRNGAPLDRDRANEPDDREFLRRTATPDDRDRCLAPAAGTYERAAAVTEELRSWA